MVCNYFAESFEDYLAKPRGFSASNSRVHRAVLSVRYRGKSGRLLPHAGGQVKAGI